MCTRAAQPRKQSDGRSRQSPRHYCSSGFQAWGFFLGFSSLCRGPVPLDSISATRHPHPMPLPRATRRFDLLLRRLSSQSRFTPRPACVQL